MNRKEQALLDHRMRAIRESEDIWGVKNKQQRQRYARANNGIKNGKKATIKAKSATIAQNNTSSNNINSQSSSKTNTNTNTGNQTTPNQPQSNNVSNNSNQPNNNTKSTPNTGSKPVAQKPNIWSRIKSNGTRIGIPIVAETALNRLNSTSPTNNELLPYDTLTENAKKQGGSRGTLLNIADAVLNPMDSYYWQAGGDWLGDRSYDIWSNLIGAFSDDEAYTHNAASFFRDYVKDIVDWGAKGVDLGGYLFRPAAIAKGTYVPSKAAANSLWDVSRDFEDIKDYSYKNLGFDDYIGDDLWKGTKAGFNNLFSRVGKNRDFYQRGRFSLNEMLSAMAKDIENHTDKNSPEYKDLVAKFERFNNLAKSSDTYWNTKKEMDASDLSDEDFLKSKNLTPEAFEYLKQSAHTLHNLGSNLSLNEGSGNKRSDYVEGNYSYGDYTDAVNKAKKYLEGDNTDIDTDTLNAFMDIGTDVGKAIIGKPVDNTTGTGTNAGTNNTATENLQSSLTPDYLTEFYKKFDKKYNYDPAKGRFNIWL